MEILQSFWAVLAMMSPWLLVGFLLAGAVSVLLPRAWVVSVMGRTEGWRGVLNAVLIGVPLPVCSCGVLPLTTGLRQAGAGKGAVAGFLIATPQTGVDSVLATYALMGPVFALARPLAALATGLLGGVVVNALTGSEDAVGAPPPVSGHCHCCWHRLEGTPMATPVRTCGRLLKEVLRTGFVELLGEVARPLAVGLALSAVVTVCVPADFLATVFGDNDWLAMPTMVLIGFPMYVCSTASIPIAASLVAKGLTPGAAFVFLMVGPAINAASLATVARLIGIRATVAYALVIALGAIVCGIGINALPTELVSGMTAAVRPEGVSWFEHTAAVTLVIVLGFSCFRRLSADK